MIFSQPKIKTRLLLLCALLHTTVMPAYASEKDIAQQIANDKSLQYSDNSLNRDYSLLMNVLSDEEKAHVRHEQKKWLKKRNALMNAKKNVKSLYNERCQVLSQQLKKKLAEFQAILITDEETINHKDKLHKIANCKIDVCNAYRAYFMHVLKDPHAKEALAKALKVENDDPLLQQDIHSTDVLASLFFRKEHDGFSDLPIWLVLENTELLTLLNERHSPDVTANYSISELSAFKKLRAHLDSMEEGRWVTTSYMQHAGTIIYDIHASNRYFLNFLSYYPQGVFEESPAELGASGMVNYQASLDKHLAPLLAWSYQGIWNRHSYITFEMLFRNAAEELKQYYERHARMKEFSPYADWVLSTYIYHCFTMLYPISETPAYQVFKTPNEPLEVLKEKTKSFSQTDWDQSLSIAILNHYSSDILEWLIASGANVNAASFDETPLMKAVDQPHVLALLLKRGANIEQQNPFGKTALFYAIQFNQFDSVKLLVEANANVNHQLKDFDRFIALHEEGGDYLLEKVSRFTPYIYSLRYASKEVTDYLLANGANPKALPEIQFKEWIQHTASLSH
jgi:uncharacterized protein YecT (DUF1311 family)